MPDEFLPIVIFTTICITLLVFTRMLIGYLREKERPPEETTLTESHLRKLVQEAVEDAVALLFHRMEQEEEKRAPGLLDGPAVEQKAGSLRGDERQSSRPVVNQRG